MLFQPIPKFALESHTGEEIRSTRFSGRYLLLYFYPKANTPGCTREAQARFVEARSLIDQATRSFYEEKGAAATDPKEKELFGVLANQYFGLRPEY